MLWVNLFRCVMCANLRLPYRRKQRPYGICNDFTDMESVRITEMESERITDKESVRFTDTESVRITDTESVTVTDTESVRITDTESVNQAPYGTFLILRIRNL